MRFKAIYTVVRGTTFVFRKIVWQWRFFDFPLEDVCTLVEKKDDNLLRQERILANFSKQISTEFYHVDAFLE